MKRNSNVNRRKAAQFRRGTRVKLRTDFRSGGYPPRVYLAGSEGRVVAQSPEHRGSRKIKTIQMDAPLGNICIRREELIVIPAI